MMNGKKRVHKCCEPPPKYLKVLHVTLCVPTGTLQHFNTNMPISVELGQQALRLTYGEFCMFFNLPPFIINSFF